MDIYRTSGHSDRVLYKNIWGKTGTKPHRVIQNGFYKTIGKIHFPGANIDEEKTPIRQLIQTFLQDREAVEITIPQTLVTLLELDRLDDSEYIRLNKGKISRWRKHGMLPNHTFPGADRWRVSHDKMGLISDEFQGIVLARMSGDWKFVSVCEAPGDQKPKGNGCYKDILRKPSTSRASNGSTSPRPTIDILQGNNSNDFSPLFANILESITGNASINRLNGHVDEVKRETTMSLGADGKLQICSDTENEVRPIKRQRLDRDGCDNEETCTSRHARLEQRFEDYQLEQNRKMRAFMTLTLEHQQRQRELNDKFRRDVLMLLEQGDDRY